MRTNTNIHPRRTQISPRCWILLSMSHQSPFRCGSFCETTHARKPQFTVPGDWGSGITVCACTLVAGCCAGDLYSQHWPTRLHRPTTDGSTRLTRSSDCSGLAVAHRDLYIARRNVAELTRYLDDQAAQLAVYADAGDESVPLMTVETFPRLTRIRAVLGCELYWKILNFNCLDVRALY